MRLLPVCLPLVLAPLIASPLTAAGQQAQPSIPQKPAQASATKQAGSSATHKTATRHRAKHHARKASARKSAKRVGACPESQFPVDVFTGNEIRHTCFDRPMPAKKEALNRPDQMRVEVINGSTTGTQVFSGSNRETAHNQPVVVGVQSSDTRFAGGNKSPVVTGVTSSSSVDAKSTGAGGDSVTKQVSPRPKRPAYAPDQH